MNKIVIHIIFLSLLSCTQQSGNFLTDEFFNELTSTIRNKNQLETFRSLPIDSAVLNYGRFDGIFQKPIKILFQDSLFKLSFEESCVKNNLSLYDPVDGYVIAAMYHKFLNDQSIDIDELKKQFYPLYIRKKILEQDNNISTALENDCFIKELAVMNLWLEDSINKINYIDADLLLNASNPNCNQNIEFSELYNETLFKYLEKKPIEIIELLENGNYNENTMNVIMENLKNPLHDKIDLDKVIESIRGLENSKLKLELLESLETAKIKYSK